jgi:ABC-type nitrate/sulfonate/bicarbonate transport system substrate-binding protein
VRTTRTLATAWAAVLALSTAACAGSAVRSGGGGDSDTIRVSAGSSLITDLPDYVAEANGFYRAHGVKIDRISTQSAGQASQLVVSGAADTGRGLAPSIQAWQNSGGSADLVSVADTIIRPPYVMVTSAKIKSWDQLSGKTIGVASPTDNGTVVAKDAFARKGVTEPGYIPAGGTTERFSALQKGAINATLMFPPTNFAIAGKGLNDIGYLPEELGKSWQYTFNSVIVSKRWAKAHSGTLVKYLQATDDALRWIAKPANKAKTIQILAKATKSSTANAEKTYDLTVAGKVPVFARRVGVQRTASARVLDDLVKFGYVKKSGLTIDQFLDDSYAKRARGTS